MKALQMEGLFKIVFVKGAAYIAGMAGALVAVIQDKETSVRRAISMLLVGSLSAGFLTPILNPLQPSIELMNAFSFFIGVISMKLFDIGLGFMDRQKTPKQIQEDNVERLEEIEKQEKELLQKITDLDREKNELIEKNKEL